MSQRDKIRKILKEESYSPNVRDNFALGVLKFLYGRLYNYISTETDMDVKEWPGETLALLVLNSTPIFTEPLVREVTKPVDVVLSDS